jgi:hypothetical protein
VTEKVQDADSVAVVAVHRTSVVPTGKSDAEAGVQLTVASETPFVPTAPPVGVGLG